MTFLYSRLKDGESIEGFFDLFERSFTVRGAPESMALFLISGKGPAEGFAIPAETLTVASEVAAARDWQPIDEWPEDLEWGLLIGHSDAAESRGVRLGSRSRP